MGIFWVIDGAVFREIPRIHVGEEPPPGLTEEEWKSSFIRNWRFLERLQGPLTMEPPPLSPLEVEAVPARDRVDLTLPLSEPVPPPIEPPEEKRKPSYILPFGNSEVVILPLNRPRGNTPKTALSEGPSPLGGSAEVKQDKSRQRERLGEWVPVSKVMTRAVTVCSPATAISEAVALMEQANIRHLPIVADKRLIGICSDRDFLGQEEGEVGNVCVRRVLMAKPDTELRLAADAMKRVGVNCLPIVDASATLLGLLTASDVLTYVVDHPEFELYC